TVPLNPGLGVTVARWLAWSIETVTLAGGKAKLFGLRTANVSWSFSRSVAGRLKVTAVPIVVVGLVSVPRNGRSFCVSGTTCSVNDRLTGPSLSLAVTVIMLVPWKAAGAEMRSTPSWVSVNTVAVLMTTGVTGLLGSGFVADWAWTGVPMIL